MTGNGDTGDSGFEDTGATTADCGVLLGSGCATPEFSSGPCAATGQSQEGPEDIPGEGHLQGSGCATAPLPAPWLLLVAFACFVRRVRHGAFVALLLLLAGPAAAVDAQSFQNADGGAFAAFDETEIGAKWASGTVLTMSAAGRPVVFVSHDGVVPVMPALLTGEAAAWLNLGGIVRVGAVVPEHVIWGVPGPIRGDVALRVTVPLVNNPLARIHSAWHMQIDLPRGPSDLLLGDRGAVRGALSLSRSFGRFQASTSMALRLKPTEPLPGGDWGNRLEWALGAHWQATDRMSLALETFGGAPASLERNVTLYPAEALASARLRVLPGAFIRVGGGHGLTNGVGAPDWRAMASLELQSRKPYDSDDDGIVDIRDLCRFRPEDRDRYADWDGCPDEDNDADGWLDPVDACPDDPETWNEWRDDDGCPDALAEWTIEVSSEDPQGLEVVKITIDEDPERSFLGNVDFERTVQPGTHALAIEAPGHWPVRREINLPQGEKYRTEIRLVPIEIGALHVELVDSDGTPIAGTVSLADVEHDVPAGGSTFEAPAGEWSARARAPGFVEAQAATVISRAEETTLRIVLSRPPVAVDGDRIVIRDEIRFAFASSEPLPESAPTLTALADWMKSHPEVELIRIEGHADEVGTPRFNYELSERRASEVLAALVELGVEPERLMSIGSGEALVRGDGAASRRVEMLVVVWREPGERPVPPGP